LNSKQRRPDRLIRVVNASVLIYGCVAFALLIVISISSFYVQALFSNSPGYLYNCSTFVPDGGTTVAIGFPLSIFAGILEGLQKFYFINLIQAVATIVRAVLIVLALTYGKGLLIIAFITIVVLCLAMRSMPGAS